MLLFFIALILWLMLRWGDDEGPLWLAALALGVAMGSHITLAFVVPLIQLLLWDGRNRLAWRDVLFSAVTLGVDCWYTYTHPGEHRPVRSSTGATRTPGKVLRGW